MFSDETRVKCPACGKYVFSEEVPSCIQWCSSARECLGDERWKELLGEVAGESEGKTDRGDQDV
jgi:hypothetical protein